MLDLFVKMTQLPDLAADESSLASQDARNIGRGIAYVVVVAIGLGLGGVIGFVIGIATGLIPFQLC